MREKLLELLEGALPQIDFTASDRMVDEGLLDSMSIVAIVGELDLEFGVTVPCEEITPENFNSLDAIVRLVERLRGAHGR